MNNESPNIQNQYAFEFDSNKCTGCQACAVACSIENEVPVGLNWRSISTYNPDHLPGQPFFHLSLACNHCQDAPCLKYCPALAIEKNPHNGIVRIQETKCIGCKYCSWVCPFDAPRYDPARGTTAKCHFCHHRLEEGLNPACVTLCPTDALNIKTLLNASDTAELIGFRTYNIQPSIELKPLRAGNILPEMTPLPFSEDLMRQYGTSSPKSADKISAWSEWTLVLLTTMLPVLAGLYAMLAAGKQQIDPLYLISTGFAAIGLSTLHLGKPSRFYRAILNLRDSWLSREVFFSGTFLGGIIVAEYLLNDLPWVKWTVTAVSVLALISMEMVYAVLPKAHSGKKWAANVLWPAALIFSLGYEHVWFVILTLHLMVYLNEKQKWDLVSLLKIIITFTIVSVMFFSDSGILWAVFLTAAGTLSERIEFYSDLEVITPALQMQLDLNESLTKK